MITRNNQQSTRSTANASSYTLPNYAVTAGSDRGLLVRVHAQRNTEADFTLACTFGGVSLTEAATTTTSGTSRWWRTSVFYLIGPAATTADIVVNASAVLTGMVIEAETLLGAAQSGLIGATDTDAVNGAATSYTLAGCTSNSLILAAVSSNNASTPTWSWTTATENYELNGAADSAEVAGSGASYETSGGDVTITATRSASGLQAGVAVELKAATGGGPVMPVFFEHYKKLMSG